MAHSIALLAEPRGPDAVAALGIKNLFGLALLLSFVGYGYYDPIAFRERSWGRQLSDAAIRYRLAGLKRADEPLPVKASSSRSMAAPSAASRTFSRRRSRSSRTASSTRSRAICSTSRPT